MTSKNNDICSIAYDSRLEIQAKRVIVEGTNGQIAWRILPLLVDLGFITCVLNHHIVCTRFNAQSTVKDFNVTVVCIELEFLIHSAGASV